MRLHDRSTIYIDSNCCDRHISINVYMTRICKHILVHVCYIWWYLCKHSRFFCNLSERTFHWYIKLIESGHRQQSVRVHARSRFIYRNIHNKQAARHKHRWSYRNQLFGCKVNKYTYSVLCKSRLGQLKGQKLKWTPVIRCDCTWWQLLRLFAYYALKFNSQSPHHLRSWTRTMTFWTEIVCLVEWPICLTHLHPSTIRTNIIVRTNGNNLLLRTWTWDDRQPQPPLPRQELTIRTAATCQYARVYAERSFRDGASIRQPAAATSSSLADATETATISRRSDSAKICASDKPAYTRFSVKLFICHHPLE